MQTNKIYKKKFVKSSSDGQLAKVIKLSSKFGDSVEILNEAVVAACTTGHIEVVMWLLEHTAADKTGILTLARACRSNRLDIVKYLVEKHRVDDVNVPDGDDFTPLIDACYRVNMSTSLYLLRKVNDLDVNCTTGKELNTALHYTIWCSKNNGNTILHRVCECGIFHASEVLRFLYVGSYSINEQNNNGDTPLHKACRNGISHIVETLILAGADETITNDDRKTPSQLAVSQGHNDLLKFFYVDSFQQDVEQGCSLNKLKTSDNNGKKKNCMLQ